MIVLINRVVATQRTCTLQWIRAKVDIFDNDQVDNLARLNYSNSLTLADGARRKLTTFPIKNYSILELNCNRLILPTIARLHTTL
ncbi:hypothetical protein TNCV_2537431 [Trichonephila clavipes]|nr:hypothetical protein TNCV_2537431 [Trichonephila clavipes]